MTSQNEDFNRIIDQEWIVNPDPAPNTQQPATQAPTHGPYGPVEPQVKTGLTPRGKAAIAIAATVIAGGSLLGWQHYSAETAANEARTAEIQLQRDQFELERQKELTKAATVSTKLQTSADKERQKKIDACVQSNKGLVGKQLGATYGSVLEDCQSQYPSTTSTDDMVKAGSARAADSGDGASNMILIGGGAIATVLVFGVRRLTRPQPAPAMYRPY